MSSSQILYIPDGCFMRMRANRVRPGISERKGWPLWCELQSTSNWRTRVRDNPNHKLMWESSPPLQQVEPFETRSCCLRKVRSDCNRWANYLSWATRFPRRRPRVRRTSLGSDSAGEILWTMTFSRCLLPKLLKTRSKILWTQMSRTLTSTLMWMR